ncbi:Acetyltransferase (GNAT) domain-containing protein [Virgibacillus subterraneus]|uniref:Acetyltransferase (GNAT) domain-containing protein n=1 Tax=Virgibacillus subterraneus TaxID=621109 RepID=A0A1H9EU77_9BACI|nr:GNAT family N-acetyltransferase [Virgibacillus subterraneus]SEQ29231.1 Acetyltransferase (GNAT) domain-containing protein [Virgibacillus subterraneus]
MATYKNTLLKLVQFDKNDVSGLIELSASVGWDYDEYEIRTIMSSGKIFGHKNAEGKIVSSAAIILYDTSVASIGMVIVDNEYRGMGLGKNATQQCMGFATSDISIMLIATEVGKPLYERMGFITVDCVHKYLCGSYTATKPLDKTGVAIEDFVENNFTEIVNLDKIAFGDSRSNFLHNRINQSEQCLVVKDNKANIIGYGISISGPINLILGPIVAPDSQTAALLLDSLAFNHQGKLRIDVPSGNDEFMLFLEQKGFIKASEPPIIITNSVNIPPRNNTLFAIAAQIFG